MTETKKTLETPEQYQPKPKCNRRRRKIIILSFLFIAVVVFWFFCIHTTPLRVAKETTYITEPLTADGKRIDYFRAMEERFYPPEMKTDDNGYRMIVQACGDLTKRHKFVTNPKTGKTKYEELISEPLRIQVYEKLGLDPNIKPTLKIESPNTFLSRYSKNRPNDKNATNLSDQFSQQLISWTFDTFPVLRNWLTENNTGINLLGAAVRKPVFCLPLVRENENSPIQDIFTIIDRQIIREFSRAVVGRARYRIGIGDIDGAIDDMITLHYLGRRTSKPGTIDATTVGLAVESLAFSVNIGANHNHPLTKEQLERWLHELDHLPPRVTLEENLNSERLFTLASLQDMYWGNAPSIPHLSPAWIFDFDTLTRRYNKMFDSAIAGTFEGKVSSRDFRIPLSFFFVRSRTKYFGDTLTSLNTESIDSIRVSMQRCECSENMQRLTLALLLYEKDHGKLPDNNWPMDIRPYLGNKAEQYFRCPSSGLAKGNTSYSLVNGGENLLVETDSQHNGYNTSNRNGAVKFITKTNEN
jgi:hypothetical protein